MKAVKIFMTLLFFSSMTYAQTGKMVIKVTGIKKNDGAIAIALFNDPETFLKESYDNYYYEIEGSTMTIEIPDLPPGRYAVSLFHDINSNKKMDKNFIGIPKEPFGFGNNAMGMFGPPGFNDSSIGIKPNQTSRTEIRLKEM
ncbi:MAG: DUF2141 domain-containing protein [Candidatus Cyclobacteriaceae bacterium M2_1C_046]